MYIARRILYHHYASQGINKAEDLAGTSAMRLGGCVVVMPVILIARLGPQGPHIYKLEDQILLKIPQWKINLNFSTSS